MVIRSCKKMLRSDGSAKWLSVLFMWFISVGKCPGCGEVGLFCVATECYCTMARVEKLSLNLETWGSHAEPLGTLKLSLMSLSKLLRMREPNSHFQNWPQAIRVSSWVIKTQASEETSCWISNIWLTLRSVLLALARMRMTLSNREFILQLQIQFRIGC